MIIIPTTLEFRRRTAVLVDYEFEEADIVPDSILGRFEHHRLDELIEFCEKNPDYHIISVINITLYFNKVLPNAQTYYLGQGDSNPDLVCFENHQLAQRNADRRWGKTKDLP